MEAAQQIVELGKYGTIGVILALILLSGSLAYIIWKIVSEHIQKSTEVFANSMQKSSETFSGAMDRHGEILRGFTGIVSGIGEKINNVADKVDDVKSEIHHLKD